MSELSHVLLGSAPGVRAGVAVYPGGVTSFKSPLPEREQLGGGLRGSIAGFSSASRRRFRRRLVALDFRDAVNERRLLWVTFTARTGTARDFKLWFDNWRRRLDRRYHGQYFLVWRLEYQRRGVAHLHIILYFVRGALFDVRGLSSMWLQVAASGSPARSAQCVRVVRHFAGLSTYITDAGKLSQSTPPPGELPGRWWGTRGDDSDLVVFPVIVRGWSVYYEFRRFVARLRRGRRRRSAAVRGSPSFVPLWRVRDSVEFVDTAGLFRFSELFKGDVV